MSSNGANGVYASMAHFNTVDPNNALSIKWDPKNLEIRTHSVEKTLEPLVMQVGVKQVLSLACNEQFILF